MIWRNDEGWWGGGNKGSFTILIRNCDVYDKDGGATCIHKYTVRRHFWFL